MKWDLFEFVIIGQRKNSAQPRSASEMAKPLPEVLYTSTGNEPPRVFADAHEARRVLLVEARDILRHASKTEYGKGEEPFLDYELEVLVRPFRTCTTG